MMMMNDDNTFPSKFMSMPNIAVLGLNLKSRKVCSTHNVVARFLRRYFVRARACVDSNSPTVRTSDDISCTCMASRQYESASVWSA